MDTPYTNEEIWSVRCAPEVLQAQATGNEEKIQTAYATAISRRRQRYQRTLEQAEVYRKLVEEHPWENTIFSIKVVFVFIWFFCVLFASSYIMAEMGIGS